jgi:hypothetical protein
MSAFGGKPDIRPDLSVHANSNAPRRFPVPWTFEDNNNACFIVKDANGVAVAYVYYEEELGRRAAANLMNKDEARRIVANIAKLPELLKGHSKGIASIDSD